jgi:hypothetical protein
METGRLALAAGLLVAGLPAAGCAGGPTPPPAEGPVPPAAVRADFRDDGRVERRRGPVARLDTLEPCAVEPGGAPRPPESVLLFPEGPLLYDPYLAAQRQSRSSIKLVHPIDSLDDHQRIEASVGLNRSLLRWRTGEDPKSASEVEFEAAVFARFDMHSRDDMESSDWRFGLPFVHRDGDVAWKIHLYHLTSHLGDELMQHSGRKPQAYHLEELAGGLSWDASENSRIYGEGGAAVYTGDPTYSGRLQSGYEWVGSKARSGLAPYFAFDVQAKKEQYWTPCSTVAVGVAYGRNFRFGVEYFRGRDTQTQFLTRRAQWVSFGLSFDY